MIKHYNFEAEDLRGRFAVAITEEDDRFILQQIAGQAPPVEVLYRICQFNPEILDRGLEASRGRKHRFMIESYEPGGDRATYTLRYCRDARIADYPYGGSLHISMNGKLNQDVDMWVGDFYELSKKIRLDMAVLDSLKIEEAHVDKELNWQDSTDEHPFMCVNGTPKTVKVGCQNVGVHEDYLTCRGVKYHDGDTVPNWINHQSFDFNEKFKTYGWQIMGDQLRKVPDIESHPDGPIVEVIRREY